MFLLKEDVSQILLHLLPSALSRRKRLSDDCVYHGIPILVKRKHMSLMDGHLRSLLLRGVHPCSACCMNVLVVTELARLKVLDRIIHECMIVLDTKLIKFQEDISG